MARTENKRKILLVDDSPVNLNVCKKILKDLYDVYPAPSADKMFELLSHVIPDLILLDVEMPGMNGYGAMRKLQAEDAYKGIPVIFLSAMDDAESEMEGLDLGAVDYIHKPFVSALLIKRIETHLAVVDGRNEMRVLNESISTLLTQPSAGAGDAALKALLTKGDVLSHMGHQIRAPLNTIIAMIESALKTDKIETIRHCLGKADIESRLILEILDDVMDTD